MLIKFKDFILEKYKNLNYRLFENPDHLSYRKPRRVKCHFDDSDSVAFAYYDDIMLVGLKLMHSKLSEDFPYYFYDNEGFIREKLGYPGRLWLNKKVISFWIYPSKEELGKVLKDIKEAFDREYPIFKHKLNFDDPEWLIETAENKLIPLHEYVNSKERSKEELKAVHLLSWAEKQALKRKGWGKGFGSDLTAWDGKNPLYWRQAKYQENVKYNY